MIRTFTELRDQLSPERLARVSAATAAMSSHLAQLDTIGVISQEDSHGCLVACVAMVTGGLYPDVRQWFVDRGKRFEGEGAGLIHLDVEAYLGDHGFVYALKYCWLCANHKREQWPPEPFAPVHILGVNGAGRHGVVMLNNGTILDPLHAAPRQLSDYSEVAYALGVWKVK